MPRRITTTSLAKAANVNRIWVQKAVDLGLISLQSLDGEDVIAVRTFTVADQIVWPGDRRSRSVTRDAAIWLSVAVNAARDAAGDPRTTPATALWLMPDDVQVTQSHPEEMFFLGAGLRQRAAFRVPIGAWIDELPPGFELHRTTEPHPTALPKPAPGEMAKAGSTTPDHSAA
ncbi:hypothetical protein BIV57_12760 [Mangrovactinospora gilvigrisea]|uniref:Uncharacterized protein n=1 Tax=Mangrovactinospora gilvigrisea TaxID=1428644 RepID=A0A1J7C6B5_9ACTN|nr:hypothetical protein [Mangrovactinospora gilvigrisea]OIV37104.1 hypothetical protein BIV57_12760 [Mangrovactinospora gilvigrisea]